jgi:Ribbon-helix-helix protein, copG family
MKKEVRIVIHADRKMADALKQRALETGVPVGELVRRAVRLAEFADARKVETR